MDANKTPLALLIEKRSTDEFVAALLADRSLANSFAMKDAVVRINTYIYIICRR